MSDLRRIVEIVGRPVRVAQDIRLHPRWLVAFLVLAAFVIAVEVLIHEKRVDMTLAHLPPTATWEDRANVRAYFDASFPIRCAFLPLRLLAGWSMTAGLLFVMVIAFRPLERVRFTQILSLEIHAEVANIIGSVAGATLMVWGNLTPSEVPLFPFSAASLLPEPGHFALRSLLTSLNIFTLWYVWIVGSGVSVLCGYRKRKAFLLSAVMWAVSASLNVALIQLLRNALHIR